MGKIWYVYDDEGTLASVTISEFDSDIEAAISLIDELIDWTYEQGGAIYGGASVKAHIKELETLKTDVQGSAVDLSEQAWFVTSLGFTFSCCLNEE